MEKHFSNMLSIKLFGFVIGLVVMAFLFFAFSMTEGQQERQQAYDGLQSYVQGAVAQLTARQQSTESRVQKMTQLLTRSISSISRPRPRSVKASVPLPRSTSPCDSSSHRTKPEKR